MPSKKERAKAARAKKAAAKAAEPPRQPALEAPRTLRAGLRAQERRIHRAARGGTHHPDLWTKDNLSADEAADFNAFVGRRGGDATHRVMNARRLAKTRERLQAKLVNRTAADEPAASDSRDTA